MVKPRRRHLTVSISLLLLLAFIFSASFPSLRTFTSNNLIADAQSTDFSIKVGDRLYRNSFSVGVTEDWESIPDIVTKTQPSTLITDSSIKMVRIHRFQQIAWLNPAISWNPATKTGGFDWENLDTLTKTILSAGAEPIYCLGFKSIYPPGMPLDAEWDFLPEADHFAAFCAAFVQHFKSANLNVRYYEVWNEPNSFIKISYSEMDQWKLNKFFTLYQKCYQAMKAVNPNICISIDSITHSDFHNYWIAHNGDVDFIDFHKYDNWMLSEEGYLTPEVSFKKAEEAKFTTISGQPYIGINDVQRLWYEARRKKLPIILSEFNINSVWDGGTDARIQMMTGAVWASLVLRQCILRNVSYSCYYTLSSTANNTKPGQGFGMTAIDFNYLKWYPYYVHWMLGNFLHVGDTLRCSTCKIPNTRSLMWEHGGNLLYFIIHMGTDKVELTFNPKLPTHIWKIDETYHYTDPKLQTKSIQGSLVLDGYAVALVQQSSTTSEPPEAPPSLSPPLPTPGNPFPVIPNPPQQRWPLRYPSNKYKLRWYGQHGIVATVKIAYK